MKKRSPTQEMKPELKLTKSFSGGSTRIPKIQQVVKVSSAKSRTRA